MVMNNNDFFFIVTLFSIFARKLAILFSSTILLATCFIFHYDARYANLSLSLSPRRDQLHRNKLISFSISQYAIYNINY